MPINPFADLLRPYFDLIAQDFEHLADEAILNNVSPDDIARDFLRDSRLRASFNKYMMPELESKIVQHWSQTNVAVLSELSKLPGLKARFGGDMGTQPSQRIFGRLGIYYDSLILPDPILRSTTMRGPLIRKDYYVLKYCIAPGFAARCLFSGCVSSDSSHVRRGASLEENLSLFEIARAVAD